MLLSRIARPTPPVVTAMTVTSHLSMDAEESGRLTTTNELTDVFERLLTPSRLSTPETSWYWSPSSIPLPISPLGGRIERYPKIRLHFVRHAQATNNVRQARPAAGRIFNPSLTPHGLAQCQQILETFPYMSKITHVLCSPLQRTLETTMCGFRPLFDRGLEIIACDSIREFGDTIWNTGDPIPKLIEKTQGLPINLRTLKTGWETNDRISNLKQLPIFKKTFKKDIYAFCYALLRGGIWKGMYLERFQGEGDIEVLIVSHGTALREVTGKPFYNAQFRSFKFAGQIGIDRGAKKYDLVESKSLSRVQFRLPESSLDERLRAPNVMQEQMRVLTMTHFEAIEESEKMEEAEKTERM